MNLSLASKVLIQEPTPDDSTSEHGTPDIFDFPSENDIENINDDDDREDLADPGDTFDMKIVQSRVSYGFFNSLVVYEKFLSFVGGSSKSKKSIKVDISNICRLLNGVGEKLFWDFNTINSYLSKERNSGKTAFTVYSRVRSLCRFIDFVGTHQPSIIPFQNISIFRSLINGMEKSLLKERKDHQKNIIANNRRNFKHTAHVLKEWRAKRLGKGPFLLFSQYKDGKTILLTQRKYNTIRGFLIAELIIPNAQRAGIIEGIVQEELDIAAEMGLLMVCIR